MPKRNSPWAYQMVKTLHKSVVRKDVRKPVTFDLIGRVESRQFVLEDDLDLPKPRLRLPTLNATTPLAARADARPLSDYAQNTGKRVKPQMLSAFIQFRHLPEDKLALLAARIPCTAHRPARRCWPAAPWTSGISISCTDGWNYAPLTARAKSSTAARRKRRRRISFLKPRKYDVVTLTPVTFLWIHDALLDAIVNGNLAPRRAVAEIA